MAGLRKRSPINSRLRQTPVINRLLSDWLPHVASTGVRRLRAKDVNVCERVPEQISACHQR
jgi:hypothetical protein